MNGKYSTLITGQLIAKPDILLTYLLKKKNNKKSPMILVKYKTCMILKITPLLKLSNQERIEFL